MHHDSAYIPLLHFAAPLACHWVLKKLQFEPCGCAYLWWSSLEYSYRASLAMQCPSVPQLGAGGVVRCWTAGATAWTAGCAAERAWSLACAGWSASATRSALTAPVTKMIK